MKRTFTSTIVGVSIALLFLVAAPAYGRGSGGHGGGGHAGFSSGGRAGLSSGAHFSETTRGYSGAGISHATGSYGARHYSSGISTGRYSSYGRYGQGYYAPRTSPGREMYRASPSSQSRTASRQFARPTEYSGSYYVPRDRSGVSFARRPSIQQRGDAATKATIRPGTAWSRQNLANRQRLDPKTTERLRNWHGRTPEWSDAKRNHGEHWRDRHHHGHDWWHQHCDAIVLVGWGYWGWYDGWWYPAWGYDPYYSYYDYNDPIYGYAGLQPDEVIAGVQAALQQLGYFPYAVDGVLGPETEAAIANYQRDYGLAVTGGIDPPTVRSLGLGG